MADFLKGIDWKTVGTTAVLVFVILFLVGAARKIAA